SETGGRTAREDRGGGRRPGKREPTRTQESRDAARAEADVGRATEEAANKGSGVCSPRRHGKGEGYSTSQPHFQIRVILPRTGRTGSERRPSVYSTAWPQCPTIYEINTWVWLADLSAKYGTFIELSSVPAQEWDAIAEFGFDGVWLMGVWERSAAGIEGGHGDTSPLE